MLVLTTLILAPLALFLAVGLVTSIRRRGWKAGVRQFGVAAGGLSAGVAQAVSRNATRNDRESDALFSGLRSEDILKVVAAGAVGGGSSAGNGGLSSHAGSDDPSDPNEITGPDGRTYVGAIGEGREAPDDPWTNLGYKIDR